MTIIIVRRGFESPSYAGPSYIHIYTYVSGQS